MKNLVDEIENQEMKDFVEEIENMLKKDFDETIENGFFLTLFGKFSTFFEKL